MSLQTDLTYSAQVVRQVDEAFPTYCASLELLKGLVVIVLPVLLFAWVLP